MQITNISEAKASLSFLIKTVQETNEAIIIGKAGKPVAILSAYRESTAPRTLGGSWAGKITAPEKDVDRLDQQVSDSFYSSSIFPDEQ